MSGPPPGWRVEQHSGSVAEAHAADLTGPGAVALVREVEVHRPTLVLGSAQHESVADRRRLSAGGVDLVRRRSGGGAVLLRPGEVLWTDVVVPAGHPRWEPDVGRAAHWLGDAWAAALEASGLAGLEVHRGGLVRTRWSPLVCFAGLGPGEVTAGGRKVVGISQRRTRYATRFQVAVLVRWDPGSLLDLLVLDAGDRRDADAALSTAAAGTGLGTEELARAFLAALG